MGGNSHSHAHLKQGLGGKDLPKCQALRPEWKTERVREDKSGDSEDGEDDELPCGVRL